jgi:hypothetical protein
LVVMAESSMSAGMPALASRREAAQPINSCRVSLSETCRLLIGPTHDHQTSRHNDAWRMLRSLTTEI